MDNEELEANYIEYYKPFSPKTELKPPEPVGHDRDRRCQNAVADGGAGGGATGATEQAKASPGLVEHSNLPTFLPFLSIFLENINSSSNPPEKLSQVLVRTLSVVDYGGRNREFGGHEEGSMKYCVWQVRNGGDFGTRHLRQDFGSTFCFVGAGVERWLAAHAMRDSSICCTGDLKEKKKRIYLINCKAIWGGLESGDAISPRA
ncbi:hypothetical protein Q3G72_017083 [Acer saccharum]|nr:hypothetical protein Q3G72_017083 [Acer saccharum]